MLRTLVLALSMLLMGCQTTLIAARPEINPDAPPTAKADLNLKAALDSGSHFTGIYYQPNKIFTVLKFSGSPEEAKQTLSSLDYIEELLVLPSDEGVQPVTQLVVSFSHMPLPEDELLGHKIIESHAYKGENGGFVVIETHGAVCPGFIAELANVPGVKFFEPNYVYSLQGH